MSGFGAAGSWPLNQEIFSEAEFESVQQTTQMVLQITEHKEQSAGVGLKLLKCLMMALLTDLKLFSFFLIFLMPFSGVGFFFLLIDPVDIW